MLNCAISKRFWISLTLLIGIISLRMNPFLIAGIIFVIAFIYNRKTVRPLKNYKFWIVILVLVLIVPIFTGTQDKALFQINYSSEQLHKTILMTLRGISVFLLFQVLTIDLKINNIKPIFTKLGIKNFDIIFNLSTEIFPKIKSILNARYNLFKISWKNHKSFDSFVIFLTDIFTDFFKLSDSLLSSTTANYSITPSEFIDQNSLSKKPSLYIIVGDAGKGKTPWVEDLIQILQNNGNKVDGIISKKNKISDDNWYHNLIRISTKEVHQLTTMEEIETSTKVGKFQFYDETILWGNVQLESISNTDWIIIDEVGLLEFDGKGFLPGIQSVSNNISGNLLFTIRPALIFYLDNFITKYLKATISLNRQILNI